MVQLCIEVKMKLELFNCVDVINGLKNECPNVVMLFGDDVSIKWLCKDSVVEVTTCRKKYLSLCKNVSHSSSF